MTRIIEWRLATLLVVVAAVAPWIHRVSAVADTGRIQDVAPFAIPTVYTMPELPEYLRAAIQSVRESIAGGDTIPAHRRLLSADESFSPTELDNNDGISVLAAFDSLQAAADKLRSSSCSPRTVRIPDDTSDEFYSALLRADDPPDPPEFSDHHRFLCDSEQSVQSEGWRQCLPMRSTVGSPFTPQCLRADRMELLRSLDDGSPQPPCRTSLLHMLLIDVYDTLVAAGVRPALLFGTMLGAIRDEGIVPWTTDVDLGYQTNGGAVDMAAIADILWLKGYHAFEDGIWRVCVAPTHPLASRLYDHLMPVVRAYTAPYVDLYAMQPLDRAHSELSLWHIAHTKGGQLTAGHEVEPYAWATVFGRGFNTLADPPAFLRREYGTEFMTPDEQWSEAV